jgi:hypothetical protein
MLTNNKCESTHPSYFRPKSVRSKEEEWIRNATEMIGKGIEKHGVGEWDAIRRDFLLLGMTDLEMELLVCAMLGLTSYDPQYNGWKGNAEAVEKVRS